MEHFLFLAFIIVFIDIIKELPLSRILAPFCFETLSVKAFWFVSDKRIYDTALPSLFIVFLSLIVVVWMDKITRKDDVLEIKNLSKNFGKIQALENINLMSKKENF